MKRAMFFFWWLGATTMVGASGCALLPFGKTSQPAETEDDVDDEEAGIEQVGALLRSFNEALRRKQFEAAAKTLRRTERALQKADDLTRSHPEFEDKERMVVLARQRLEIAVEKDRIERRNAAINQLAHRARQALARGVELQQELAVRVPTPQDIELLSEILQDLRQIQQDGRDFQDDSNYASHAEQRDRRVAQLAALKDTATWQLQLTGVVGGHISAALAALDQAKKTRDGAQQLHALQAASKAFVACTTAISDSEGSPQFNASLPIETRLGRMTVEETKKKCLATGAKVRGQSDKLAWMHQVNSVVEGVNTAMAALTSASDATARLQVSPTVETALTRCLEQLDDAMKKPGFDREQRFQTALGNLPAKPLRDACGRERAKLERQQAAWKWQKSFDSLASQTHGTYATLQSAQSAPPQEAIPLWQQAETNLRACAASARSLAELSGADKAYQAATAFGPANIGKLIKVCTEQADHAKRGAAQAKLDHELQTLVKDLQGDEVTVARREGIPSRIDTVKGGRIFVYSSGGKSRTFEFDSQGKQVSFAALWREKVERIGNRIDAQLGQIASAPDGQAKLKATHEAMEWLEKCHMALEQTESDPGFAKQQRFKTKLGSLTALQLRDKCKQHRQQLDGTQVAVKWQIRFEEVAARVQEARNQSTQASDSTSAQERVKLVGAAIGGYTECIERTESLAKTPGYNRTLRIPSAFGAVHLEGLAQACTNAKRVAEQALSKALQDQELEAFINKAKGDEKSVARREGLPTRIEELTGGRVFVYEPQGRKGKVRRFAFDGEGKRVAEQVLQAKQRGK